MDEEILEEAMLWVADEEGVVSWAEETVTTT